MRTPLVWVRRGEVADLYVENERCVVMVGESVLVLAEVATAIIEAVPEEGAVAVADVAAAVVELFGEPDPPYSAEELTLQHVHDLVAHGVLSFVEGDGFRDGTSSLLNQRVNGTHWAAVDALRSALRHIRSGDESSWPMPATVAADDFVAAAHQHHVVALLALHLERLDLPARARFVLRSDGARLHAGAQLLAGDLGRALDALDSAGVRALAFKGIALAVQVHGDLTARGAGDLDLLVAPEDLLAAYAALTDAGWIIAPGYPKPGSSWAWRHLVRNHFELTLLRPTSSIDLHWCLTPTRSAFPSFEALWQRRHSVVINGRIVPTLSPYDALAHSAGHAAMDRWRWLHTLVDVHVMASRPDVWRSADRPLRRDQVLSVGIASRMFGEPPSAPGVLHRATRHAGVVWRRTLEDQTRTEAHQAPMPGLGVVFRLRMLIRTGATPREVVRWMSRNALPPWLTSPEASTHPTIAVPRVLCRRALELGRRVCPRSPLS